MKKYKTLIAFIILILLIAGYIVVVISSRIFSGEELSSKRGLKVSGMVETVRRVEDQVNLLDMKFSLKTESSAELMSYALEQFVTEDGYDGPEIFDNGMVVRVEDGKPVLPETVSVRFPDLNSAEDLDGMSHLTGTRIISNGEDERTVLLRAKMFADGLYYVEWTEQKEYQDFVYSRANLTEAIRGLEKSYDACMLMVSDQEAGQPVIYHSEKFGEMETLGDIGLSGDILSSQPSELKIGDEDYKADYERLTFRGRQVTVIVLSSRAMGDSFAFYCIIVAAGFMLLCLSCMILWVRWVGVYVRDHTLTESQEKAYRPSKLRRTAAAVGVNGALLLLIILTGYQLMGNLSRTSDGNQEMLNIIMARLENDVMNNALQKDGTEVRELQTAKLAADLYGSYPEFRNREFLVKAAEVIGCKFIMIFGGDGKEIMSSNNYVDFTLGEEISTTEDFRLLLHGIEQIIHDPETDPYTGNTIQLAGVSIIRAEDNDHEAMLLAFDWDETTASAEQKEIAGYINMLTPEGYLSLVIDQKDGRIVYCSNEDFVGFMPAEIGLDESDLIPTSLSPFEILRKKTYGAFNENEQYRCYYNIESAKVWGNSILYSAISSLAYLVICLILSLYLLGPSQINFSLKGAFGKDKQKRMPSFRSDPGSFETGIGFPDSFREPDFAEQSLKEWWQDLTPGVKAVRLLSLLVTLIQCMIIISLISGGDTGSGSVVGFLLNGSWKRGVNDLALLSIFCVLFLLLAFILIKGWLMRLLCSVLNPKGETIARLISSLLQYISIITAVCICLSFLGLDTGAVITSAGILTLAISLGSKDLVADILSGIFIIFEGDFQVGDIIEVNGFRGRVLEIGVRSTKLKDTGRNIKIIDNQSVKNILNLSKENSWLFISLDLSNTQPLQEIEDMLTRELPKIVIPELISGPFYFGVGEIRYHRISLTIGAECRQQDLNKTKSILNRELLDLFEKNGYKL